MLSPVPQGDQYSTLASLRDNFTAYLAKEGLQHRTIKAYLSGVRFLHIAENQANPFQHMMNKLNYVLGGVKQMETKGAMASRPCLPMSPNLPRKIKQVWEEDNMSAVPPVPKIRGYHCINVQ